MPKIPADKSLVLSLMPPFTHFVYVETIIFALISQVANRTTAPPSRSGNATVLRISFGIFQLVLGRSSTRQGICQMFVVFRQQESCWEDGTDRSAWSSGPGRSEKYNKQKQYFFGSQRSPVKDHACSEQQQMH